MSKKELVPSVYQMLVHAINLRLQKFLLESVNGAKVIEIYEEVKRTVFEVFSKTDFNLEEKSKKWLCLQFLKSININGDKEFLHAVYWNNVGLNEISIPDLRLMIQLFNDANFATELEEELQRRT